MTTPTASLWNTPPLLALTILTLSGLAACEPAPTTAKVPSQAQEPTQPLQLNPTDSPTVPAITTTPGKPQQVTRPTPTAQSPTDESAAHLKRVPPTLNFLKRVSGTWASLEDYQRWFSEGVTEGTHPLVLFSSPVKSLDHRLFQIKAGDTVADIGCGTGALEFSLIFAEVPFKKLYAVDIDDSSLAFLETALKTSKSDPEGRIETVLSSLDDVNLPENSIDVMLVLFTRLMPPDVADRSALESPAFNALFNSIKKALKSGGRFHIVDSMLEPAEAKANSSELATRRAHSLRNYGPEYIIKSMSTLGFVLTSETEMPSSLYGGRNYLLSFSYTH